MGVTLVKFVKECFFGFRAPLKTGLGRKGESTDRERNGTLLPGEQLVHGAVASPGGAEEGSVLACAAGSTRVTDTVGRRAALFSGSPGLSKPGGSFDPDFWRLANPLELIRGPRNEAASRWSAVRFERNKGLSQP